MFVTFRKGENSKSHSRWTASLPRLVFDLRVRTCVLYERTYGKYVIRNEILILGCVFFLAKVHYFRLITPTIEQEEQPVYFLLECKVVYRQVNGRTNERTNPIFNLLSFSLSLSF